MLLLHLKIKKVKLSNQPRDGNETLKAKIIQLEENLAEEKSNAKSSQEAYKSKIKVYEENLQSQKRDNHKLLKLLKFKDTIVEKFSNQI